MSSQNFYAVISVLCVYLHVKLQYAYDVVCKNVALLVDDNSILSNFCTLLTSNLFGGTLNLTQSIIN